MSTQLTELVLRICCERDAYVKRVLIQELKELLDKEGKRLKHNSAEQPA